MSSARRVYNLFRDVPKTSGRKDDMPRAASHGWHDLMVGQRIFRMRMIRRLSLEEAAKGAVSHQQLSRIERGKHFPTKQTLEKLAANLKCPAAYLAKGPNPPTNWPDREKWILDFFGSATPAELRELFKDEVPLTGRQRMPWLLNKAVGYGPQKLKSKAEELVRIQAERARR